MRSLMRSIAPCAVQIFRSSRASASSSRPVRSFSRKLNRDARRIVTRCGEHLCACFRKAAFDQLAIGYEIQRERRARDAHLPLTDEAGDRAGCGRI